METKDSFKKTIEFLIANAQTKEDLNVIGAKFNEVIDNKLNIDIWDYQLQAAKKMTEIYNKLNDCDGSKHYKLRVA
jgi:hypothetical protein